MLQLNARVPTPLRQLSAAVVAILLILAVVAVNGRPTVFTDTDDYYSLGKEIAVAVGAAAPPELSDADIKQAAIDAHMGRTQMASRSALYGVFLFALEEAGSLWLVTAAQAAFVAWLLLLLWRAALPPLSLGNYLLVVGVTALVSPLPFFVGFAMPDIFAGIAVVAATLLLVYPGSMSRTGYWIVVVILAFALGVHTSHILFIVPELVVAALVLWWLGVDRGQAARRLGTIGVAIVLAVGANSLYGLSVRLKTGEALRSQPFLTARVLADGPGRDYLRHACAAGEKYTLCAFARKPLDDSEEILWSDLPATGVFLLSDYAIRIKLENEEPRFILGTLAYAPLGQTAASLRNWGRQLAEITVDDPLRNPVFYLTDPYWRETYLPQLIRRVATCGVRGNTCPSRLTPAVSRWWHGGMLIAAIVLIGIALQRLRRSEIAPGEDDRRRIAVVILFITSILVNAAVCGMLSGPFARYQSRIVWLVPVAAGLLLSASRRRQPVVAIR